ncbi:galactose-binding domain-like protein [Kickxella alabastrina]|uniref:galactose-binding domain-like protein n=1 Tax=Kickxella alabastrina TaxID=61397 RepID=UPI00221EAFA9|nr:galactose-binding domain-like protein [Kickxella alabastrina]KAI7822824.1 galactose-binding domain-like protein [Kickxella alabastrina]
MAINIERTEQFVEILRESGGKLVVVDFYSKTCPPCLIVDQILGNLTMQFPNVSFYKVDIGQFSEVAMQCRITATPTLQFFRKGRSINEVKGANKKAIVDAIEAALSDNGSEGQSAFGVVGHADLTKLVMKTQSECLNQNDDRPLENVFSEGDSFLESDVDEQMVLHIAFNQPIKLHSIMIKAPLDRAPKHIKLFSNRSDLGFDDAETSEATQEIELTEDMYKSGGVINLRYVRFQNINNLSIFVADNLGGDDVTVINQLAFIGTAVNVANMSDINRGDDGHNH